MTNQQGAPEALRLADCLDSARGKGSTHHNLEAAAELRRLHAENESLQARIKTMAEEHADELTVAHLDGRMRAAQQAPQQEPTSAYLKTMELAESVGLIGPTSRTHDLHAAIQRFHDLICANATIKAAQMAAEVISKAAPQQEAAEDVDGHAFRTAARLGLTLRFYGGCAQSGMPGSPSAYEVCADRDRAAAMRDAVARAEAVISRGGEAQRLEAPQQERVYLVATGETLNGRELYERHEKYVPLADCETLYTAPQPSPASQGDALDAARYRWLREHRSIDPHANPSVPWVVRCEFQPIPTTTAIVGEALDAAIDAARAAQEVTP